MDKPEDKGSDHDARITLSPDMRPVRLAGSEQAVNEADPAPHPAIRQGGRLALWLGALGVLAGLAGLAAASWVHLEAQTEIRRIASENAQLRVSLDLYARNMAPSDSPAIADLANRVSVLEETARTVPSTPVLADTPAPAAGPTINEDCLPSGMRLLVAEGDSYPVCGQNGVVNVAQVSNGYIVLLDGTTIASGGSILLPGSTCTIAVTSGGDEGLTGYAEIRVTC